MILSGTYPLYHQVRDNGGFNVPGELDMVSEVLEAKGYDTSAFIGAYVLHSKWGMNQGFDTYNDDFDARMPGAVNTGVEKRAGDVLDSAREWLDAHKDKKYFSWIHLYDPHSPYEAPPPHEKGYRGEVEYTDAMLGRFFQFLKDSGLYDKSLIIVTADHGEDLNQHGEETHGLFIYETSVQVPLIIRAPNEFPEKHIKGSTIVELVDVAPTILDALDIPAPDTFQGVSLLNLLYGKSNKKKNIAYTESYYSRLHFGWSELKGIYSNQWKFISAPHEELFDILEDGGETENLALKKSLETRRLRLRLQEFTRK
jgi:arylsulfatase A-like enzyme